MPGGRPKGQPKTGGRQKGTINRLTMAARQAIELAAEELGGWQALAAWARAEPRHASIFWGQIFTKLLPLQVTGANDGPVQFENVTDEQRARALTVFLAKNGKLNGHEGREENGAGNGGIQTRLPS